MARAVSSLQPNVVGDRRSFSWRFWAALILTGIGAGLAGGLLMRLLFFVERTAWPYGRSASHLVDAVARASAGRKFALLVGAGIVAGIGRRLLQRRGTGGHGAEVNEAIWRGDARMPVVRTFCRAVLSIVIVGVGAALGREGAVKQSGAACASGLGLKFGLSAEQRKLLMACGAGAGVAAAYNVPFAGAIFAAEVLLGTLAIPQIAPALVASLVSTAVSWIFLPNRPIYPVSASPPNAAIVLWAAVAGPILGMAAAVYIRVIAWADSQKPRERGLWKVAAPVFALAALAVAALRFPQVLGNGKDVVEAAYQLRYALGLVVVLFFLRLGATTACLAAGIPGGLFTPTLSCGSLLGGCLGLATAAYVRPLHPATCAIVGGGAFLAAAMEGPVSAVAFMLELTHDIQPIMVPLLLAVAGAVLVARALETRSIYSARIRPPPA